MSNFSFLQAEFPAIHEAARQAEGLPDTFEGGALSPTLFLRYPVVSDSSAARP